MALSGVIKAGGRHIGEYSPIPGGRQIAWVISTRPGPTQHPVSSSAGTPQAKQPTGQEHSATHQQAGGLKLPEPTAPLHTPLDMALPTRGPKSSSTHQWAGTSPSYQEALHKTLDQPHPPGGRHQKQENYHLAAWGTESANTGQNLPWGQLVPGPWVTRGACTAGTHRTSPTEGHFFKVKKSN